MFSIHFLFANLLFAISTGILYCFKRVLGKLVPVQYQYLAWLLIFFSLIIPFIPIRPNHAPLIETGSVLSANDIAPMQETVVAETDNWFTELSGEVSTRGGEIQSKGVILLWTSGVALVVLLYLRSVYQLYKILRMAQQPACTTLSIFRRCQERIHIENKKIVLLRSEMITAPFSFGFHKSYIIVPADLPEVMEESEVEKILLHELIHVQHKDVLVNYLFCILRALCWFNPFVWIAFSQMQQDREAYCDWAVLNLLNSEDERLSYGYTILHFARTRNLLTLHLANGLCGGKSQLKYRIEKITQFREKTWKSIVGGLSFMAIVALLISMQFPALATFVDEDSVYYPRTGTSFVDRDFSKDFGNSSGCAVIYDCNLAQYLVYNRSQTTKRIAPCSTIKIYSAINALEQGAISCDSNTLAWDHTLWPYESWNGDQNLNSAISNSVNWFFQELDISAGRWELQDFYEHIGYGNRYVGNDPAYYWNGKALKISAVEQVDLLRRLYENEYDFQPENISAIKDAMLISGTTGNKLYGKTGTGYAEGKYVIGWFVGCVETADNTYFFAVELLNGDHPDGSTAEQIAHSIFDNLGISLE